MLFCECVKVKGGVCVFFKFKVINDSGFVFNIEFYLCVRWFIEKFDEGVR